ncbi:MAG: hypothetical protein EZS28_049318, partial [Streblomastix strix]
SRVVTHSKHDQLVADGQIPAMSENQLSNAGLSSHPTLMSKIHSKAKSSLVSSVPTASTGNAKDSSTLAPNANETVVSSSTTQEQSASEHHQSPTQVQTPHSSENITHNAQAQSSSSQSALITQEALPITEIPSQSALITQEARQVTDNTSQSAESSSQSAEQVPQSAKSPSLSAQTTPKLSNADAQPDTGIEADPKPEPEIQQQQQALDAVTTPNQSDRAIISSQSGSSFSSASSQLQVNNNNSDTTFSSPSTPSIQQQQPMLQSTPTRQMGVGQMNINQYIAQSASQTMNPYNSPNQQVFSFSPSMSRTQSPLSSQVDFDASQPIFKPIEARLALYGNSSSQKRYENVMGPGILNLPSTSASSFSSSSSCNYN